MVILCPRVNAMILGDIVTSVTSRHLVSWSRRITICKIDPQSEQNVTSSITCHSGAALRLHLDTVITSEMSIIVDILENAVKPGPIEICFKRGKKSRSQTFAPPFLPFEGYS